MIFPIEIINVFLYISDIKTYGNLIQTSKQINAQKKYHDNTKRYQLFVQKFKVFSYAQRKIELNEFNAVNANIRYKNDHEENTGFISSLFCSYEDYYNWSRINKRLLNSQFQVIYRMYVHIDNTEIL